MALSNLEHPGTPTCTPDLSAVVRTIQAIDHIPPGESPDEEYPFLLSTGRILYHYNVTTPYSPGIQSIWSEEMAEVNPDDADRMELRTGDMVRVASRRGEITTKVQVTDRVPPGLIWMSFHYADSPTNVITSAAMDPITKTGEYKICGVKVEKIQGLNICEKCR